MADHKQNTSSAMNDFDSTTSLILQSIRHEWQNNASAYESPGHLMRECLTKAGLMFQGLEAMRIHAAIFTEVFIGNNVSSVPVDSTSLARFSAKDYFELMQDEKLGWLSFLNMMLPYLKLSKANDVLEKLTEFISNKGIDKVPKLTDFRLILCSMTVSLSIILDSLPSSRDDKPKGSTPQMSVERLETFRRDSNVLFHHVKTCLEMLLQLCSSSQLFTSVLHDIELFRHLVTCLAVVVVISNPYFKTADLTEFLQEWYLGRVQVQEVTERGNPEKKLKRNEKWMERCQLDEKFIMTEVVIKKEAQKTVASDPSEIVDSLDNKLEKDNSEMKFHYVYILIDSLKSALPISLYVDILQFFCRGDFKSNENFYQPLVDILLQAKPFKIGLHLVSGKLVYLKCIQILKDIVSASVNCPVDIENIEDCKEFFRLVKEQELFLPHEFSDLPRLRMTGTDLIVESGRKLSGKDDLDLLKRAVENQEKGWQELLTMGLKNTEIDDWWNAGFLELVSHNETTLSTGENVMLLLNVLYGACNFAAGKETVNTECLDKLNQVFKGMFQRLPTILQEQVILSAVTSSNPRGGGQINGIGTGNEEFTTCHPRRIIQHNQNGIWGQMGEREIAEELTPLLNKLTVASVNKLMSNVLQLCLYDADTVIRHCLQVASENRAQVQPVVEVFRNMPHICHHREQEGEQSKLIRGLHEILQDLEITDTKEKNLVSLFAFLTEGYTLVIDDSMQLQQEMPGLLSLSEFLAHVLLPSLNQWTNEHTKESAAHIGRLTSMQTEASNSHGQQQTIGQALESSYLTPENESQVETLTQGNGNYRPDAEELANRTRGTRLSTANDAPSPTDEASYDMNRTGVKALPLHACLNILSALLAQVKGSSMDEVKPFPLLVILANIYSQNYAIFKDGELDKTSLILKQASQKNVVLFTTLVMKQSKLFSGSQFLWLKQQALRRGWLHTALLKPVLNIGCDLELQDVLISLTRQIMSPSPETSNIKGMVLLTQLALVNDEMFVDVTHVLKLTRATVNPSCLQIVIGHILMMSLCMEMSRLTEVIKLLLSNQDQPQHKDQAALSEETFTTTDSSICLQISQYLTDAVLQLSANEVAEASQCHIISNYQVAIQSLLTQDQPEASFLMTILHHHCILLSHIDGEAAQILQVSAMDLLTRLKALLHPRKDSRRDSKSKGISEISFQEQIIHVQDHTACVKEDGVKATLLSQMRKMF